jgi:hypothetical protein
MSVVIWREASEARRALACDSDAVNRQYSRHMRRLWRYGWVYAVSIAVVAAALAGCAASRALSTPTQATAAQSQAPAVQTLREFLPALQQRYPNGVVVGMKTDTDPDPSRRQPGWQTEVALPGERDHPLTWLLPDGTIQQRALTAVGRKLQDGEEVADLNTGSIASLVDSDVIQTLAETALGVPERVQPRSLFVELNGPHTTCTSPAPLPDATRQQFAAACDRLSRGNLWLAKAVLDGGEVTLTFEADTGQLVALITGGQTAAAFAPIGWSCSPATEYAFLGCVKTD